MAGFLNIYNQRIDKTRTVQRVGKNGIHYEYVMPRLGNSMNWQVEAMDVKSKKSPKTKYKNGKKPGQYQPIGDKTYFNFYCSLTYITTDKTCSVNFNQMTLG